MAHCVLIVFYYQQTSYAAQFTQIIIPTTRFPLAANLENQIQEKMMIFFFGHLALFLEHFRQLSSLQNYLANYHLETQKLEFNVKLESLKLKFSRSAGSSSFDLQSSSSSSSSFSFLFSFRSPSFSSPCSSFPSSSSSFSLIKLKSERLEFHV